MSISAFTSEMNRLGQEKVPFLFVVDFEMEKPLLIRLTDIHAGQILFDANGFTNALPGLKTPQRIVIEKFPVAAKEYKKKFHKVFHHLEYGDSFLTNLTIKTEVKLDSPLRDIFFNCQAKYKLLFEKQFLVFSPETFVQIRNGKIFSYPMKGTINGSVVNAKEKILHDQKEISEHVTIVDLIRNDLSQVASNVQVTRFRYIDEIHTGTNTLLQVSSEIVGELKHDYFSSLGDILVRLLPAGSVSGAPKPKTLEIIRDAEEEKRGYYTGVFGVFNGRELDSGVMIRFIENQDEKYFYRSGGGITTQSLMMAEYQEAIDKVYVPVY
jgi:para-aminobenzoate synthetase component I